MLFDQMAHFGAHPFRVIGNEHGRAFEFNRLRHKRNGAEPFAEQLQIIRVRAISNIGGEDQPIELFGLGKPI